MSTGPDLSRLVTHALLRAVGVRLPRAAPLSAYWKAMVTPTALLHRRYLHRPDDAPAGAAGPPAPQGVRVADADAPERPHPTASRD